MYLVPLASHEAIPSPLLPFNGPGNVYKFCNNYKEIIYLLHIAEQPCSQGNEGNPENEVNCITSKMLSCHF